jgi:hypothetical protein
MFSRDDDYDTMDDGLLNFRKASFFAHHPLKTRWATADTDRLDRFLLRLEGMNPFCDLLARLF